MSDWQSINQEGDSTIEPESKPKKEATNEEVAKAVKETLAQCEDEDIEVIQKKVRDAVARVTGDNGTKVTAIPLPCHKHGGAGAMLDFCKFVSNAMKKVNDECDTTKLTISLAKLHEAIILIAELLRFSIEADKDPRAQAKNASITLLSELYIETRKVQGVSEDKALDEIKDSLCMPKGVDDLISMLAKAMKEKNDGKN